MILFYQSFRLKYCNNYVGRVKIDLDGYVDLLGRIVIAKYSIFVILEHAVDII